MINFEIDFRNATQAEIDAFYAITGMQSAISFLQTHNRKYNTTITVIEPGNQLVEVKAMIMEFMRSNNLEAGHAIPEKPFLHGFYLKLNPKKQQLIEPALKAFVDEGVLTEENGVHRLTELGFGLLY